MALIGIAGKKFSGKSSSARILQRHLPGSIIMSFGDEIKRALIEEGVCTYEDAYFLKTENFRKEAQRYGNEKREKYGDDFFIISLAKRIRAYIKENPETKTVIIDDVRLNREADWIVLNKGFLIKTIRKAVDDGDSDRTEKETERIRPDAIINNDKDLDALEKNLSELIEEGFIPTKSKEREREILEALR